jgi:hypothetical protein
MAAARFVKQVQLVRIRRLSLGFVVPESSMIEEFSNSIFVLEADRRPIIAFSCRKQGNAEALIADEAFRKNLQTIVNASGPLVDAMSIFRVRLARYDEKVIYYSSCPAFLTPDGQIAVSLAKEELTGTTDAPNEVD